MSAAALALATREPPLWSSMGNGLKNDGTATQLEFYIALKPT